MPRKQTFKRRPNKAGTVVKLSGKRRCPWCAKITTGKDIITGRQIQTVLGTFETWDEADDALTLYRLGQKKKITDKEAEELAPDTFQKLVDQREKNMPTFKELYTQLYPKELSKLSVSRQRGYKAAFKRLKPLHNKKISQIALNDMQHIVDITKKGFTTKLNIKIICSKVFEYAVINQYITRDDDYTEYIKCGPAKQSDKHYAFASSEIKLLINDDSFASQLVLIYIFTGLRANELLNIPKKNIHIDADCPYLVTGSKSQAGRGRVIPIHKYIEPYIKNILLAKGKRRIDCNYNDFRNNIFDPLMDKLNIVHTPHDTRDTFATLCNENKVDLFIRKRILGHKMKDITFDTYTSTVIETLYKEINKIEVPEP